MVHVGVDLHKRMSQIAVLTEEGEIAQRRLANDPARLEAFFAQLPPRTPVAIEASGTWWWLVDLLESAPGIARCCPIPNRRRRSRRRGSRTTAWMPSGWRCCSAETSCRRYGFRRPRSARPANSFGIA